MNYLEFLQKLISFGGAKLPRVLALLQDAMDLLTKYSDLLSMAPVHNASEPTEEELALEAQVCAECHLHGAIGDGSLLKALFAFVQAHPKLVDLLFTFIK